MKNLAAFKDFYLVLSTLAFGFMFTIWKRSDWPNTFIKFVFFVLTVAGVFLTLKTF